MLRCEDAGRLIKLVQPSLCPTVGQHMPADDSWRAIGLISDTHRVFDPAAAACLHGRVDLVLHAGDVGEGGGGHAEVLRLYAKAIGVPVLAVGGNTDVADVELLPDERRLQLHGWDVLVTHIASPSSSKQGAAPWAVIAHIVVHGHSHIASVQQQGGTLYVNPGSAGPARFKLKRSVAVMQLPAGGPSSGGTPTVELLALPQKALPRLPLRKVAAPRPGHCDSTATAQPSVAADCAAPACLVRMLASPNTPTRSTMHLPAKRTARGAQQSGAAVSPPSLEAAAALPRGTGRGKRRRCGAGLNTGC